MAASLFSDIRSVHPSDVYIKYSVIDRCHKQNRTNHTRKKNGGIKKFDRFHTET